MNEKRERMTIEEILRIYKECGDCLSEFIGAEESEEE